MALKLVLAFVPIGAYLSALFYVRRRVNKQLPLRGERRNYIKAQQMDRLLSSLAALLTFASTLLVKLLFTDSAQTLETGITLAAVLGSILISCLDWVKLKGKLHASAAPREQSPLPLTQPTKEE